MSATMVKGDIQLQDAIEMSEPGNALRFALMSRGMVHYVSTLGGWMVYKDGRWVVDDGGVVVQKFAKMVPQSIFTMAETLTGAQDEDYKALHLAWGRKSNTEPQLARLIKLARDLDGVAVTMTDFDTKPLLFNMLNGTYDFKTNQFREHDPGDLLTKRANVVYDTMAECPVWLRCLTQWQPDITIQRFLQEITGSGLIGEPVQNLFVNVGDGRNGKGTFYKTIQNILSEYANTAPEDMLVETRWRVHDEERARLRGCRFLLAPETSVGDRLNEAGIKNMTGGDMMHARHLYGKAFDFMPTHTAFLHTNYDPIIRGTDSAIWNRVKKIRWETYIKEDQRDRYIDDKLEVESSGILNWLITGCQRWRVDGLQVPAKIARDTESYRAAQDHVGNFVETTLDAMVAESRSTQGADVDYLTAGLIRNHYERWCQQEGLKPWVASSVGKELHHKGWTDKQKKAIEAGTSGKKVNQRVWMWPTAVTAEPTSTSNSSSLVTVVTPIPNRVVLKIDEEETHIENSLGNDATAVTAVTADDWEPSEEQQEQRHREWLYDHGYPVPPTEEEIERDQASRVYEDTYQPDWVE